MAPLTVKLDKAKVDAVDLGAAYDLVKWHSDYIHFFAQNEAYRLLAYLAARVPGRIVDIGSTRLHSAAALWVGRASKEAARSQSSGAPGTTETPETVLETFDAGPTRKQLMGGTGARAQDAGIVVRTEDPLEVLTPERLATVGLIALDVEPHDGTYERIFIQAMLDRGYRGLLVLDNYRVSQGMQNVYRWAPVRKVDVTDMAHWSGTAVLVFNSEHADVVRLSG